MTFQPPSKSFTSRDYLFIALVVIVFLIVSAALFSANLTLKGGGDFYVHWVASRGFVYDQIDPYGGEVPARVQTLVYGAPAQAGDKPYILDTPFHLLLLYFPFAFFTDPQSARAFYLLILELAWFALSIFSLRLTEWEAPRLFTFLFIAFAVFNFYTFQAIQQVNPVLLLGLLYVGILFALRAEMNELAGALVAVSFYYWEVGAPFLFLVFLRAYRQKQSGVFAGFFMVSFILLFVSFLLYPYWIIPFLRAVSNNLRADFGYSVRAAFADLFPSQSPFVTWGFIAALFIALAYEWSVARDLDFRRFYWASCLSIAAAPLLGFRTEMGRLAVLAIPLALIFAVAHDRWHKIANFLVLLLMLFMFLVPWALALIPFQIAREAAFLFLPLFTIVGLYWIRWWAIRPPRIWSDRIGK